MKIGSTIVWIKKNTHAVRFQTLHSKIIIQKEKQHVNLPLSMNSVVVFMSGKGQASLTQNKSLIQTKMQDLVPGM